MHAHRPHVRTYLNNSEGGGLVISEPLFAGLQDGFAIRATANSVAQLDDRILAVSC